MSNYVLSSPEYIYWIKDSQYIIVVNDQTNQVALLSDLQAALWSWMSLSYGFDLLSDLTARACAMDQGKAKEIIHGIFNKWQEMGIVTIRIVENDQLGHL